MKTIATAALLTAIGGGVALAQGAPPSFIPWQSGWQRTIKVPQAQFLGAIVTRSESRMSWWGMTDPFPPLPWSRANPAAIAP